MDTKAFYTSKTFWCSVAAVLTPVLTTAFPPAGIWLAANADTVCGALGLVFGGLRFATDTGVHVTK